MVAGYKQEALFSPQVRAAIAPNVPKGYRVLAARGDECNVADQETSDRNDKAIFKAFKRKDQLQLIFFVCLFFFRAPATFPVLSFCPFFQSPSS